MSGQPEGQINDVTQKLCVLNNEGTHLDMKEFESGNKNLRTNQCSADNQNGEEENREFSNLNLPEIRGQLTTYP